MFCKFLSLDNNSYQCIKCGTIITVDDGMTPTLPCLGFTSYTSSENIATFDEIERRYDICSKCEFFKDDTCSQCGCLINRYQNYNNKLNNKDSRCPKDKW